jgi:hypothetical protein
MSVSCLLDFYICLLSTLLLRSKCDSHIGVWRAYICVTNFYEYKLPDLLLIAFTHFPRFSLCHSLYSSEVIFIFTQKLNSLHITHLGRTYPSTPNSWQCEEPLTYAAVNLLSYLISFVSVLKLSDFSVFMYFVLFFHGATALSGPGPPHCWGFTITLRHTTLGKTPLDEWSSRRRDLHQTTHNTHKRQISMPSAGFELEIPACEGPQTHALDRAGVS